MAQYRATITNGRGKTVSRLGHKTSGLEVELNGWDCGIRVSVLHIDGKDVFEVYYTSGSNTNKAACCETLIGQFTQSQLIINPKVK